jgi:hypothetical protein
VVDGARLLGCALDVADGWDAKNDNATSGTPCCRPWPVPSSTWSFPAPWPPRPAPAPWVCASGPAAAPKLGEEPMAAPRVAGRGSPALGAVREGGFEEGRWPVEGGGGGGRGGRAISTATAVQEVRARPRRAEA